VRGLTETRCRRGADIARKLRFSERVAEGIYSFDELWDGAGHPQGLAGDAIPIFSRIALLATVIDVFHNSKGADAAREEVRKRSGAWFDPALARAFERVACHTSFWAGLENPNIAEMVFALEPAQHRVAVDDGYLDDIAAAFGQVVDAKSPFTAGHSARVELYADAIAAQMGVDAEQRRWIRRAALLHDVGKLGVSNALLDKPARLEGDELAAVRAHARHTHTILSRISAFSQMAMTAAAHHERIDGAGYPFGLKGEEISFETRVISTADFFDALTADRPYRKAMPIEQAMAVIKRETGPAIDPACFEALANVVACLPAIQRPSTQPAANTVWAA
jgi:HD-GYP domain-containing protein (c-di-GMP phosphodiesterase class II)